MEAGMQLATRLSEILNPWPNWISHKTPETKATLNFGFQEKCSHRYVQWILCWPSGTNQVPQEIQEHETLTIGLSENALDIWSTEWCLTSLSLSDFALGFYFGDDKAWITMNLTLPSINYSHEVGFLDRGTWWCKGAMPVRYSLVGADVECRVWLTRGLEEPVDRFSYLRSLLILS